MTDVVSPPAPGLHHVEFVMGMAVSIDLRDAFATHESVIDVVEWLHHVDDTFSTHKTDSAFSALGRGELSVEALSEEILEVLSLCESVRTATDGAFDVFEVPAPNGTRFDPSGLVKGWSIERAAALLEAAGCSNFCLNAGGDIAGPGRPEPGGTWKIGIRHPFDDQAIATVVECPESLAVATSASYERGAHIVDPARWCAHDPPGQRHGGRAGSDPGRRVCNRRLCHGHRRSVVDRGVRGLRRLRDHVGRDHAVEPRVRPISVLVASGCRPRNPSIGAGSGEALAAV